MCGRPSPSLRRRLRQAINNTEDWKEFLRLLDCLVDGVAKKAGRAILGEFSGNPKRATITFVNEFEAGAAYEVVATPHTIDGRTYSWSVESQTAAGFVLNLGTNNISKLDHVAWIAIPEGE